MNFWRVTCGNPNQGKKGPCCYAWTACDVRGRDNWNSTRNSIDPIDLVKGQFQTRPHPEAVTSKALSIFDPNPTNQSVIVSPSNAGIPVSISYSTQPNAQMSARRSTDLPWLVLVTCILRCPVTHPRWSRPR